MNSLVIAKNIIKRVGKERSTLVFLLVLPILAAVLSSSFAGGEKQEANLLVAVAEIDSSEAQLIEVLPTVGSYEVVKTNAEELVEGVDKGTYDLGIIGKQGGAQAQLVARSDDEAAQGLMSILTAYYEGSSFDKEGAYVVNPSRMTAGFLTMLILFFMGTGMGMIFEDKRGKTLMRIYSTPIKSHQVVLGNLLAHGTLGGLQIALFFLMTKYVVNIEWGVPLWQLFVIAGAFMIAAIGLGVGLTGILKSQQQFGVVSNIVAVVTSLVGGAFFPPSFLSGWLAKVSNFCPQKWFMAAFDELSAGASLVSVSNNILILLLFGAVFLTFGIKTLTPRAENL